MPNQEKKTNLAQYDSMDTLALQEILRADASKTEGDVSDQETILHIMEVLAERRKALNQGKSLDEAWEIFRQSYEESTSYVPGRKPVNTGGKWKKSLVAAAAAVVVLLGGTVTAQGFGVDLWQTVVKWTQETLHIGYMGQVEETRNPSAEYENPCSSLQDSLEAFETEPKLAPTWLPEGYEEADVEVSQSPTQRVFSAVYLLESKTIRIRIADYLDGKPFEIEQSDSLLEVYEKAGVKYYIFENEGQLQAVWIIENYECYISGSLTLSEMKQIIDSIGTGENT